MRLSGPIDITLLPPDPATRESGVEIDPDGLEASVYLEAVDALYAGKLVGEEWIASNGCVLHAEMTKRAGKRVAIWRRVGGERRKPKAPRHLQHGGRMRRAAMDAR